jgi:hypothetical protein
MTNLLVRHALRLHTESVENGTADDQPHTRVLFPNLNPPEENRSIAGIVAEYRDQLVEREMSSRRVEVPERHQEVMGYAQILVSNVFRGSPAEAYLADVRGLDPVIARSLGAGYGSDRLIHGLLDAQLTLDDLVTYGFLGFSPRVRRDSHLVRLLEKRGVLFADIVRKKEGEHEPVDTLPYSLLHDRVTFPLMLGGKPTSFYGRALSSECPKYLRHRKLAVSGTGIPHGGFNLEVIGSGSGFLIVCEGVMDALTLIEMGFPDTCAMVGVRNERLTDEIASFSGSLIGIAMDNDPMKVKYGEDGQVLRISRPGAESATKLVGGLYRRGYQGSVANITAALVAMHPDRPFKDINEYWTTYRAAIRLEDIASAFP